MQYLGGGTPKWGLIPYPNSSHFSQAAWFAPPQLAAFESCIVPRASKAAAANDGISLGKSHHETETLEQNGLGAPGIDMRRSPVPSRSSDVIGVSLGVIAGARSIHSSRRGRMMFR